MERFAVDCPLVKGDFAVWDEAGEFGGHCDVEAGGWMGCGVDRSEAVDAHMGVALGCLEAGVAEHFGDVADVGSAFQQQGGDGVPEEVAAPFLVDVGVVQVAPDLAREPVGADRCADGREEELPSGLLTGEAWAGEVEIQAQPKEGALADRHVAVFRALTAPNEDGGAVEVDVRDGQVDQLLPAQGAGIEDLKDRAVAQAERPRQIRLRQQRRHLRLAEGRFGKTAVRSRHQKVAGGVGLQLAAATEPGEEVGDRDESLYLRGDGERLPALLAVLEQLPLVALQELERDRICRVDPVLLAEAAEVAEIATPAADRRVGVVVNTHPEQVLVDIDLDRRHGRGSFPENSERSKLGCEGSTPSGTPPWRGGSVRRYYDPQTGQFISVDPAVDQTEAPYAYINGDPVDGVDPIGLGCGWTSPWDCATTAASTWYAGAREAAGYLPSPGQVGTRYVGFVDGVTSAVDPFGYGTADIRNALGLNGGLDECSLDYTAARSIGSYDGYAIDAVFFLRGVGYVGYRAATETDVGNSLFGRVRPDGTGTGPLGSASLKGLLNRGPVRIGMGWHGGDLFRIGFGGPDSLIHFHIDLFP